MAEFNDLPFRSRATGEYRGETVPVMHACGHDTHVAILMGVAAALTEMQDELQGTVKFIFQPAEEGAPEGEEGGAELMAKEGRAHGPGRGRRVPPSTSGLSKTWARSPYRSGPTMASVQDMRIVVKGRQTHGAAPWAGVDPIVTASPDRRGSSDHRFSHTQHHGPTLRSSLSASSLAGSGPTSSPTKWSSWVRSRTFDPVQTETVHRRIREIAENIGESAGATVEVQIPPLGRLSGDLQRPCSDRAGRGRALEAVAGAGERERGPPHHRG